MLGFMRIVALQILLRSLTGALSLPMRIQELTLHTTIVPTVICVIGAALAAIAAWRGPPVLRKAMVFGGASFAASLLTPLVSLSEAPWHLMTLPAIGERYFVFPMLAWLGVLFVLAADRRYALRAIGVGLIAIMVLYGVHADWHNPYGNPVGFKAEARAFMAAPPGTRMEFPIRPTGTKMVLIKLGPA